MPEHIAGRSLNRCHTSGCDELPALSLVWPGQGRIKFCLPHYERACAVARALGLSQTSLDVALVESDYEDP
jgi:hypothetical protein